ncbi:MAG: 30S ribosomal protein S16 [bacterium]|nr:30S ribosomal protein S16 [bacterium]
MLTIRLTRKGKKNQPFFRVVVIDKRRSSKGGRAVEEVGYVDPLTKKKSLKKDRILHWIKNGAQPSATIHNLLVTEKIIDAPKINKFKKSKKAAEAAAPASPSPAASAEQGTAGAAPVAEAPKEEAKVEEKPAEAPAPESKPEEPKAEEKPA